MEKIAFREGEKIQGKNERQGRKKEGMIIVNVSGKRLCFRDN